MKTRVFTSEAWWLMVACYLACILVSYLIVGASAL